MTITRFARSAFVGGLLFGALAAGQAALQPPATAAPAFDSAPTEGVVRVRSIYPFAETVSRIKAAIAANGIQFFGEIDQSRLAAGTGIDLHMSTLLLFGNPPLGLQLLTANPYAGLDWPVRMLVTQDDVGTVWIAWTDFGFIAKRYAITDRDLVIAKATSVAAMLAASAAQKSG
ncbi:MAG TPA: DUF302 domain-containing protein [Acetobacteraceae bacterium]|nr:DUF302 domain-containing protein [Acetobacteraceae bacterium]